MFFWDEQAAGHRFAVTCRAGGVSQAPYDSLNLGGSAGDEADAVRDNRGRVAEAFGVPPDRLLFIRQVHGAEVVRVDGPWSGAVPSGDAMVTTCPGLALGVLAADCAPVMLADPVHGVAGVAHAGRHGMDQGVVLRLVDAMRDLGAREIVGRIGPSVCPRCYPVPDDLRASVATRWPVTRSVSRRGEPAIDVAAGVLEQLRGARVDVTQLPGCTVESQDLYSYRRDRTTGRFAGLVVLPPRGSG